MVANIVYSDDKDRKLLELVPNNFPIFINFINFNSGTGRKEAYKIKGRWGAKLNPFVEILDDKNEIVRCFYSENGNAIFKMVNWLNGNTI